MFSGNIAALTYFSFKKQSENAQENLQVKKRIQIQLTGSGTGKRVKGWNVVLQQTRKVITQFPLPQTAL